jgi:hypothetical protein
MKTFRFFLGMPFVMTGFPILIIGILVIATGEWIAGQEFLVDPDTHNMPRATSRNGIKPF